MVDAKNLFHHNALVQFEIKSPEAMYALGKAFAPLLHKDWNNAAAAPHIERIGLVASGNTGKSVFVSGLTDSFSKPLYFEDKTIEINFDKSCPQSFFHTLEAGFIRHVDAGFSQNHHTQLLRAFRDKVMEERQWGGVDIVENANCLNDITNYDAAFRFDKFLGHDAGRLRKVYFYASPEFQAKPDFGNFVRKIAKINNIPEIA